MRGKSEIEPGKETRKQSSEWPKGVGAPAQRALASAGITRLTQLTRFSETELLKLHGMGPKAIRVLESALQEKGLAFKAEKKS